MILPIVTLCISILSMILIVLPSTSLPPEDPDMHHHKCWRPHQFSSRETKSVHKTVAFSEGQRIENDFNMNPSVIQVKNFVIWATLKNAQPIWFSWLWASTLLIGELRETISVIIILTPLLGRYKRVDRSLLTCLWFIKGYFCFQLLKKSFLAKFLICIHRANSYFQTFEGIHNLVIPPFAGYMGL